MGKRVIKMRLQSAVALQCNVFELPWPFYVTFRFREMLYTYSISVMHVFWFVSLKIH